MQVLRRNQYQRLPEIEITLLTVVNPICIDGMKVYFTQTSHEWYFPKDSLHPRTDNFNVDITLVVFGIWYERDMHLVWFEAILTQI